MCVCVWVGGCCVPDRAGITCGAFFFLTALMVKIKTALMLAEEPLAAVRASVATPITSSSFNSAQGVNELAQKYQPFMLIRLFPLHLCGPC